MESKMVQGVFDTEELGKLISEVERMGALEWD